MLASLLLAVALGGSVVEDKVDPLKQVPPGKKELFAREKWYQDQEGKEQDFVGVLEKVDRGGRVGFGRFNPYRLKMKDDVREVYIGGKPQILAEYVGRKVKLSGKAVNIGVEGKRHREIWPARVEVITDEKGTRFERVPADKVDPDVAAALLKARPLEFKIAEDDKTKEQELKIQARGFWRAPARPGSAAQQLVLRNAVQAAKAMNLAPDGRSQIQATRTLAQALKVETIDWDKQMVIVVTAGAKPTGGYSVEVLGITARDKTLTVRWKLNSPGPDSIVTQAFTHPAQAVLVEKAEGEPKFVQEKKK